MGCAELMLALYLDMCYDSLGDISAALTTSQEHIELVRNDFKLVFKDIMDRDHFEDTTYFRDPITTNLNSFRGARVMMLWQLGSVAHPALRLAVPETFLSHPWTHVSLSPTFFPAAWTAYRVIHV